jgi:hypothetical protein
MRAMRAATGWTMRIDERAWREAEGREKSVSGVSPKSFSADGC